MQTARHKRCLEKITIFEHNFMNNQDLVLHTRPQPAVLFDGGLGMGRLLAGCLALLGGSEKARCAGSQLEVHLIYIIYK